MAEQEKIITIPLRKYFRSYPRWRRTKVAVRATRAFLQKHLKTEEIVMGKFLNEELHERGRKYPPPSIQVKVWKDKERFMVESVNAPKEEPKPEIKKKQEVKKIETTETPAQEKKEALEKEKEEVLAKGEQKEEHHVHKGTEGIRKFKKELKRGEGEHHKEIFPKSQKPSHEKKLSK